MEDYQKRAMRTNDGKFTARLRDKMNKSAQEMLPAPGALIYGAIGLTGEAGEVADCIKKYMFHGHDLNREDILKELGDVLWYVALICDTLDTTMDEVMEKNIDKLLKRYPEGFSEAASRNRREYGQVKTGSGERIQP